MKIPGYWSWQGLKRRCLNTNQHDYRFYGGRGITYDPAWETFDGFLADMGERPEGTTLDRIDCDGNYCKDNCRWATKEIQATNRRVQQLPPVGPLHGIQQVTPNCFKIAFSFNNKTRYYGSRNTLEEAIIFRDECLAKREAERLS